MEETAMQEFMKLLNKQYPDLNLGIDWNYFKELERKQIETAYKQGIEDWTIEDLSSKTKNKISEKYYLENYKNINN